MLISEGVVGSNDGKVKCDEVLWPMALQVIDFIFMAKMQCFK